jgi:hypothetical protein
MIKGVHALFYSAKVDELRDFIKDKLRLPYSDVGDGWLVFDLKEGDVGCHPTDGRPPSGTHDVSFYTDDLRKTVAELKSRGVEFDDEITSRGYGLVTHLTMPGGVRVQIYQPRYTKRPRAGKPAARKAGARKAAARKGAPAAATRRPAKPRKTQKPKRRKA